MIKELNELVTCANGFSMSVQANSRAYCYPREKVGPYEKVEVGFPNKVEPLLLKYAENPDEPTRTVYGYVPKSVVTAVIAKHGGMISGDLPEGVPYLYAPGAKKNSI